MFNDSNWFRSLDIHMQRFRMIWSVGYNIIVVCLADYIWDLFVIWCLGFGI